MDGQLSIFDLLEPEVKTNDFNTMTIYDAAEQIGQALGCTFTVTDSRIDDVKKEANAKIKEFKICINFSNFAPGVNNEARYLGVNVDHKNAGAGSPAESIEEAIYFIKRYIKTEELRAKNFCIYSEHKCNKKELFSIADTLDDIKCPRTCCRLCQIKICGARCNGA